MIEPAIPKNEKERLAALHRLSILNTVPEERFDRVTRLLRKIFDLPMATVTLVDEDRQWFKSADGLGEACETDRGISFCGHTILSEEPLIVNDALADERFRGNPLVVDIDGPRIRFYAGYPLRAPGGLKVGALCLLGREPRAFGEREVGILKDFAAIIEDELVRGAPAVRE